MRDCLGKISSLAQTHSFPLHGWALLHRFWESFENRRSQGLLHMCMLKPEQMCEPCSASHMKLMACAQVLASFENGRFEGWLHMRTLKPEQMCEPAMAQRIARRLRHFHGSQIPGSQDPQTFTVIKRWCVFISPQICIFAPCLVT